MKHFAGKVAVVTRAASGIGRALAERFAREGMSVVLADVEAPALDQAVREVRAAGGEATGVVTTEPGARHAHRVASRRRRGTT